MHYLLLFWFKKNVSTAQLQNINQATSDVVSTERNTRALKRKSHSRRHFLVGSRNRTDDTEASFNTKMTTEIDKSLDHTHTHARTHVHACTHVHAHAHTHTQS